MIMIMSPRLLDCLAGLSSYQRRLGRGEQLFAAGDPVRQVHAVTQGEIHLLRRQEDGSEFILQRAGPGAIVAEASVVSDRFHCAAEAVTDSTVTIWPIAAVRDLVASDLATAEAYARHLAAEVRIARQRAEIASLRRVGDRLDAWLAWHGGALPEKGRWQELARELSVTPEALYRELARRRRST